VSALRIALLDHAEGAYAHGLDGALRAAGHEPHLVGGLAVPTAEALLRRRGFTPALSHVPRAVAVLLGGEFDLAHAFTAPDAVAALAWRQVRNGPAVFTCTEAVDRGALANGRLRLSMLEMAIDDTDAFVAAGDDVRTAIERWFACSPAAVMGAGDVAAHERLYRALLA
jgi:hypothetical protein